MSAPRFLARRCRPDSFTLIEMVITIAIFILLAGAVFGIIQSVLESAVTLQDNQNHRDQVGALNEYLKKKLGTLPAQSSLTSFRSGGTGLPVNSIVFGGDDEATVIDVKLQPNGYFTLRIALMTPDQQLKAGNLESILATAAAEDDPKLNWATLVHDVKTVGWKFQDLNATDWVDDWTNPSAKPNLVEFTIQIAGDLKPVTMDFWVPHLEPVTVALPQNGGTNAAP